MKIGIILETKEFEKVWNAMRFATAARNKNNVVKVFLMGEAVEIETLTHEKFDVAARVSSFIKAGGEILACGTCLKSRQMESTDVCPISTMSDCIEMVEWADKVVCF